MLRFVLGRSSVTTSQYLKDLFAAKAQAGETKLIFIVPDQISFETESAFLSMLGARIAQHITVLGFSRLCDLVFEKTGHRGLSFADDGVRHVVMSIALEQLSDQLTLFSSKAADFDLCELMLSGVKEFKQCAIDADQLIEVSKRCEDEALRQKLYETALVYDAFEGLMKESFLDPLDSLSRVAKILEDERLFEGYTIAVDGFFGFTAQEYQVLEQLTSMASEMLISLPDDFADGQMTEIFTPSNRTKRRLMRMAHAMNAPIAPPVRLSQEERFSSDALAFLEEQLYRYRKESSNKEIEDIRVYRGSNIYDECDYVARRIKQLVESGYRYREIAIIARDLIPYNGVLDQALETYGIGFFMDRPYNINAAAPVRLINSAFSVAVGGFDREDVLALLKTGLTSFSVEDIAEFENYLFTWDVSRGGLKQPFVSNPDGFSDSCSEEQRERLTCIEALRSAVIEPLSRFENAIRHATGEEICKAIMRLLFALKVEDNITALCDTYDQNGETTLADDLVRVYNECCAILDKMVSILSSYQIEPARFSQLLRAHFSAIEIANIPRGSDQVDVALADRALHLNKRAVFVIGMNEGSFPRTPVETGVFTDDERIKLKEENLALSDSIEELSAAEKYYVYGALTAAKERLFISSYAMTLSGESVAPSNVFSQLFSIFPRLSLEEPQLFGIEEHLLSEKAAFDYLVAHCGEDNARIRALRAYFSQRDGFCAVLSAIDAERKKEAHRFFDKRLSRKLFQEQMTLSASRVESYYRCPFSYFCRYGLGAKKRNQAKIDALEYGTLIHFLLEQFLRHHAGEDYNSISQQQIDDEIQALMEDYAKRHLGGLESKGARFEYLYRRIFSTASALVGHIVEELSQSAFVPTDFELSIGDEIPAYSIRLDDGATVRLVGSVDRVDVMEKEGERYLRVIDYKTGTKEFRLSDILYGINLQMFIYLSAIRGAKEKFAGAVTPAGVLYMPAVRPKVAAKGGDDAETIKKEQQKQFAMKGVLLESDEVVEGMEKEKQGVYIPVAAKGDALKPSKDGALLSLEQFGAVFRKVDALVEEMARSLHEGDVDDRPVSGRYKVCEYCDYQAVCHHRNEEKTRVVETLPADEVIRTIMTEVKDDGANMDESPATGD